jgi:coenzyme PQQ synthesis protein D (PqqD)
MRGVVAVCRVTGIENASETDVIVERKRAGLSIDQRSPYMELSLRHSITVAPDIVFREVDGEAVILNLETGFYFGLDQVGTRIWQLIQEHGSLQKVFETMCDEFDVGSDALERDLLGLMDELCVKGLVRASPE